MSAIEDALMSHPFLVGMQPVHTKHLAELAMPVEFVAGEYLFHEGEPANRFYVVESGTVAIESVRQDQDPVVIQTAGAGDVLGWSWLFPPYYWLFSTRAIEPTRAVFLYGTPLREKCDQDAAFGYAILSRVAKVVIQRLQATRQKYLEHPCD
jgi:CRP-like cAMP-binding protein